VRGAAATAGSARRGTRGRAHQVSSYRFGHGSRRGPFPGGGAWNRNRHSAPAEFNASPRTSVSAPRDCAAGAHLEPSPRIRRRLDHAPRQQPGAPATRRHGRADHAARFDRIDSSAATTRCPRPPVFWNATSIVITCPARRAPAPRAGAHHARPPEAKHRPPRHRDAEFREASDDGAAHSGAARPGTSPVARAALRTPPDEITEDVHVLPSNFEEIRCQGTSSSRSRPRRAPGYCPDCESCRSRPTRQLRRRLRDPPSLLARAHHR